MTPPKTSARDEAITLLAGFCQRILPCILRRIARWRRIPGPTLSDLAEDIRQELALDCLENAGTIVSLTTVERHRRWMRRAERWVYQQRLQQRCMQDDLLELTPAPAPATNFASTIAQPTIIRLGNGRANIGKSALSNATGTRSMRRQLEEIAAQLGCDADYDRFWRHRLAEAMTGLAADQLSRATLLLTCDRRGAPALQARWRRLRRIGARIPVRPATLAVRRLLQPWLRSARREAMTPRQLLEQAVQLAPGTTAPWLWLFEATFAAADLPAAAVALRSCRQHTLAPKTAITLARARLLEARGRFRAALFLLHRAVRRWPLENKLRAVLRSLGGTPDAARS